MSTVAMKRININIPFDLLNEVEIRAKEHNFTRSKLIREFLHAYLNELKKRELREKLKEGYLANANRDQQIFICRVNPNTKIYELTNGNYEELNFDNIKRYMTKQQLPCLEKQVYLGLSDKLNVRLMIYLLPEEIVNERLRKARRNNNKKGRGQISKQYQARAHFNLFITNGDKDVIPIEKVYLFYKLRWQIELMFKIWKSLCNIDKVKKVKRHRLECYIYSRLIFIVFAWQIIWITATVLFAIDNKPLSFFKTYKTLIRNKLDELRDIFLSGAINMSSFLIDIYEISRVKHILEKKKNELTSLQIILTCIIT